MHVGLLRHRASTVFIFFATTSFPTLHRHLRLDRHTFSHNHQSGEFIAQRIHSVQPGRCSCRLAPLASACGLWGQPPQGKRPFSRGLCQASGGTFAVMKVPSASRPGVAQDPIRAPYGHLLLGHHEQIGLTLSDFDNRFCDFDFTHRMWAAFGAAGRLSETSSVLGTSPRFSLSLRLRLCL